MGLRGVMDIGLVEKPQSLPFWFGWKKQTENFMSQVQPIAFVSIKKFAAATLVFGLLLQGGLFSVLKTGAYFNDSKTSENNTFIAGTLGININSTSNFTSGLMYPTDATSTAVSLSKTGNLDYQYTSQINLSGSDTSPCDYVNLIATDGANTFSGLIKNFVSPTSTPSSVVNWNYNFSIATNTPPSVWGKTCFFKWMYTAWQTNLPDPLSGFTSIQEKLGSIRIGKAVVLNEFIPNPTGLDDALKPGGEWAELYNNSNINFNVGTWVLYDETDTGELYITTANTNTGGTIVAPHSYLVVYRNGDSDFNLNNKADSVRLYTGYPIASSTLVDSYTYTTEKPEGFSYARIPDGVGSWVDPIPTPGEPNTLVLGFEELFLENIINPVPEISTSSSSPVVSDIVSTVSTSTQIGTDTSNNALSTSTSPEIIDEENSSSTPLSTPEIIASSSNSLQSDEEEKSNENNLIQEKTPRTILPNSEQVPAAEPPFPPIPVEPDLVLLTNTITEEAIKQPDIVPVVAKESPAPVVEPAPVLAEGSGNE